MGHEGPGRGAAVDRLERGGLDLDEAPLVQEAAHAGDGARAGDEGVPDVRIGHQVQVAPPEAGLRVAQPGVLVGRRPQRLGQEGRLLDDHAQLAAAGAGDRPRDPQDVAQVEVQQRRHGLLAEAVDGRPQLDAPAAVVQVEEGRLALAAARGQAAGDADRLGAGLARLEGLVGRPHGRDLAPPLEAVREGLHPARPQCLGLGATLRDQRRETALGRGVSRCDPPPGCRRSGTGGRRAAPGS